MASAQIPAEMARLDGPDAALRAELTAAIITGISFLREKVGTGALSCADRETLRTYVNRMSAPLLASESIPTDISPTVSQPTWSSPDIPWERTAYRPQSPGPIVKSPPR